MYILAFSNIKFYEIFYVKSYLYEIIEGITFWKFVGWGRRNPRIN